MPLQRRLKATMTVFWAVPAAVASSAAFIAAAAWHIGHRAYESGVTKVMCTRNRSSWRFGNDGGDHQFLYKSQEHM